MYTEVGSRDLKMRLGAWLERVRRGEVLVVTDRGVPVAELRPITAGAQTVEERLESLAAQGFLTLGTREALAPFEPIPAAGAPLSAAIDEDRGDRA